MGTRPILVHGQTGLGPVHASVPIHIMLAPYHDTSLLQEEGGGEKEEEEKEEEERRRRRIRGGGGGDTGGEEVLVWRWKASNSVQAVGAQHSINSSKQVTPKVIERPLREIT